MKEKKRKYTKWRIIRNDQDGGWEICHLGTFLAAFSFRMNYGLVRRTMSMWQKEFDESKVSK